MPANGVNLDALVPREDFATISGPAPGNAVTNIGLVVLKDDFFVRGLRKPDFQRETSNWTPQKIVDLIGAFLEGDLIPAIILWRSGQYVFVVDGAHRLSALLAWVYDDYGDRHRSANFFENQVPEEQLKLGEQTRKLVAERYGSYASYVDATSNRFIDDVMKERVGMLNTNSLVAQWVPAADAQAAEKSFFKINQAPTPVDPVEKRILRGRTSAVAIATRAINRGGVGHKYWAQFDPDVRSEIETVAKSIYGALYLPPLGDLPIKSSDVPIGGRGYSSLPFVFELVQLVNGIGAKETMPADPDGAQTVAFLKNVLARLQRITGTGPASLGLHPLVYFYTRGGQFQPLAFLAVTQFVDRLEKQGALDRFTAVRARFETFVMAHKEAFTMIQKTLGSGARSRPALEAFLWLTMERLEAGDDDAAVVAQLAQDKRFAFLAVPPPVRVASETGGRFSRNVKTAAFVTELMTAGVRCGICGALVHRNSVQTDHRQRRADGGGGDPRNAQPAHPYCNSTFKERAVAKARQATV